MGGAPDFDSTQWSMVLAAADSNHPQARAALELLCARYWQPLYVYARRRGHSAEEAQDLTQAFFLHLIEKDALKRADPARGRFRSFLLTSAKHFLANAWDHAQAEKRGGAATHLSLDFAGGEALFARAANNEESPERVFERQWAMALLGAALDRVCMHYARRGQEALFDLLKAGLPGGGEPSVPYAELGAKAGMSEGAIKVAAHRLRERYRKALRAEVARTLEHKGDTDEELRYLMGVLGG